MQIVFLLLSLALLASAVGRLVPRWIAWRGGQPDTYSGVLSATASLLMALIIALQVLMQRVGNKSSRHRFVLYGVWGLLMAGFLVTFALEVQAERWNGQ